MGYVEGFMTGLTYAFIFTGINILAIEDAWFKKWGWRALIFGNFIGACWLVLIGEYFAATLSALLAGNCFIHYRIQTKGG